MSLIHIKGEKIISVVAGVLVLFIAVFAINVNPARGATLYEQTTLSTLGEPASAHPGGLPVQRLGTGLSGAVGSVSYKINGSNLSSATSGIPAGYGEVQVFECGSSDSTYSGSCVNRANSGFAPQFISQSGNDAYIRVDMTASAYSFNPNLYYFLKWVIAGDLALYGSANDTYPGGPGVWIDPAISGDANTADIAFRICDTADCDLRPLPALGITSTSTNLALPTITGTTTGTASVEVALNGKTYAAAPSAGAWSVTLPAGDELPSGDYAITASSTNAEGRTGSATRAFVVDFTAPALSITAGPADQSYASAALVEFSFTATDNHLSAVSCAWDGVATSTCSSPISSTLADGAHTFVLAAGDSIGNSSTLTRAFTVNTASGPEPAPAPAASSGGGGGGGVIGGPMSVGYQIPYLPPPAPVVLPAASAPQPVQTTASAPVSTASAAPSAAPAKNTETSVQVVSDVQTASPEPVPAAPVSVVTPWDTPAGEQTAANLAAAAATSGLQLPNWLLALAALILALAGGAVWFVRRRAI